MYNVLLVLHWVCRWKMLPEEFVVQRKFKVNTKSITCVLFCSYSTTLKIPECLEGAAFTVRFWDQLVFHLGRDNTELRASKGQ